MQSTIWGLRQEDYEFQASLEYTSSDNKQTNKQNTSPYLKYMMFIKTVCICHYNIYTHIFSYYHDLGLLVNLTHLNINRGIASIILATGMSVTAN